MSMQYIRDTYDVPAKRGARIGFCVEGCGLLLGTIVGSRGHYLRIRLDGESNARNYHPTWALTYMTPNMMCTPSGV